MLSLIRSTKLDIPYSLLRQNDKCLSQCTQSDSSQSMAIIKHYNHCAKDLREWKHSSLESGEKNKRCVWGRMIMKSSPWSMIVRFEGVFALLLVVTVFP